MIELQTFLGSARWFGGKGRPFRIARVERVGELPGDELPTVVVDIAVVEYADDAAGVELYQLPMSVWAVEQDQLGHALIGVDHDADQKVFLYDAVHDHAAMARVLRAFGEDATATLSFHTIPGHPLDLTARSSLLTGEQSNSSVAFGEDSLLKVFRKLTPGANPDIEIHTALTRAGSEHIAALFGWIEADSSAGRLQLGMLQQFLRTATDGFDLAQTSVRNLFAEADLRAAEVGGDFSGESARLGETVAAVHALLRSELATGEADLRDVARAMTDRLAAAAEIVPELRDHAPTLAGSFTRLGDLGRWPTQRVHGDLHLGQTLRTVKGWKIVDFEGEPAKDLAERVRPDLVWRDIAGMVRSFDYAARIVERTVWADNPASSGQLSFRTSEWVERNAAAFVTAYLGREPTPDERTVLAAYLADKAVYEAVYETRNRPDWAGIPLGAIARLRT